MLGTRQYGSCSGFNFLIVAFSMQSGYDHIPHEEDILNLMNYSRKNHVEVTSCEWICIAFNEVHELIWSHPLVL